MTNTCFLSNYTDLILCHPIKFPNELAIQCKWQSSGGGVDEKYPFEVLKCRLQSSGYNHYS